MRQPSRTSCRYRSRRRPRRRHPHPGQAARLAVDRGPPLLRQHQPRRPTPPPCSPPTRTAALPAAAAHCSRRGTVDVVPSLAGRFSGDVNHHRTTTSRHAAYVTTRSGPEPVLACIANHPRPERGPTAVVRPGTAGLSSSTRAFPTEPVHPSPTRPERPVPPGRPVSRAGARVDNAGGRFARRFHRGVETKPVDG